MSSWEQHYNDERYRERLKRIRSGGTDEIRKLVPFDEEVNR